MTAFLGFQATANQSLPCPKPVSQSPESSDRSSDLLSIAEAVKYSGLSASTLWRYIARRRLPKVQHGGCGCRVMLRRLDLMALSAAEPGPAPAPEAPPPTRTKKLSGRAPAWKKR